ncbi:helix-turn-helix protein [Algoriphagus chordae]|uniref:Helix-turn-helix protein n=2 Tax=Algoriphagus chordae TaxID=237019 RepID=A0A2W7QK50_9BACT|nr:helix-turn-helix protein [Algoriphagus chordae]
MFFYPRGFETTTFLHDKITCKRSSPTISGQLTQRIDRLVSQEFLIIQVAFHPGALHQLTGIPFHELINKFVELENIYPIESSIITDQLAEAKSYQEMISLVDSFLLALFNKKSKVTERPFDKVIPLLYQGYNSVSIDKLASDACLSIRQFERLSKDYLGVSPKMMQRISRFTSTYIMRARHPEYSWLQIALDCGYEDYQHLVRDYKDFSEVTPNQLVRADQNAPDRVLGLR